MGYTSGGDCSGATRPSARDARAHRRDRARPENTATTATVSGPVARAVLIVTNRRPRSERDAIERLRSTIRLLPIPRDPPFSPTSTSTSDWWLRQRQPRSATCISVEPRSKARFDGWTGRPRLVWRHFGDGCPRKAVTV